VEEPILPGDKSAGSTVEKVNSAMSAVTISRRINTASRRRGGTTGRYSSAGRRRMVQSPFGRDWQARRLPRRRSRSVRPGASAHSVSISPSTRLKRQLPQPPTLQS
jgi:hypothetical protein